MSKTSTSTSIQIFRSHIRRLPDGTLDARGVISEACYAEWLACKRCAPSDLEAKRFYRALTNHTSSVDGRVPFEPLEEAAILKVLREKQPWPCLPEKFANFGKRYRSKGFHEKKRIQQQQEHTPPNQPVIGSLTPFMSFSSALPLRNPTVDRLERILLQTLSTADATYVRNLGETIFRNFVANKYSLEEYRHIQEILRYSVLAKSSRVCTIGLEDLILTAKRLCDVYSNDPMVAVLVLNQTGRTHAERFLAENARSVALFGELVSNVNHMPSQANEIFPTILCIGAAVHQPGQFFSVKQKCTDMHTGMVVWFDVSYLMDPTTMLLVVLSRRCDERGILL